NTYDGTTLVNQGVLRITNGGALGSAAKGTMVLDGAQLQLQGGIIVVGEALTISGTGIFGTGVLLNTGGNNTWRDPVTRASLPGFAPPTTPPANVAVGVTNAVDTLTIDGVISQAGGTFGLSKVAPGKLTLTKANTYGGVTTIFGGSLRIQNGA